MKGNLMAQVLAAALIPARRVALAVFGVPRTSARLTGFCRLVFFPSAGFEEVLILLGAAMCLVPLVLGFPGAGPHRIEIL